MKDTSILPAHKICFGLDRSTDEFSIHSFVQRFADDVLLDTLIPRLEEHNIQKLLDCLSAVIRKHFSEKSTIFFYQIDDFFQICQ